MAGIPKNHDQLYFDKLIRTQKAESVLALIHASYHSKDANPTKRKEGIIDRLKSGYELFKDGGAGTYNANLGQFQSQYTIGHELAIWINSDLVLTKFAEKVAKNEITIKQYFDIFFLNYFQPVNNSNIHPLYQILLYLQDNDKMELKKNEVETALGCKVDNENINGLFNMLIGTNYFVIDNKNLKYVGKYSVSDLIKKCNIKYLGADGYQLAKAELDTDLKYANYISLDSNIFSAEQVSEKEKQFTQWMKAKGLKSYTIRNYLNGIRVNSSFLGVELYAINGKDNLEYYQKMLADNQSFTELNEKYHYQYSASINKYIEFESDFQIKDESNDILEKNDDIRILSDDELENIKSGPIYDIDSITGDAVNEIYYGTPGCGKSFEVNKKYVNDDNIVIRTVFHPEYSNSDFVGQIVPVLTEIDEEGKKVKKITYEYKNGPFINALIEAIRNKDKKVILIIEEINRGNASAIFGEIFQLLDRNDKGISNYHITNKQITEALDKALEPGNSIVNIKIPGNLYIVATMNTSDQNVFTLDTAFKRRWDLIRIPNDFKGEYGEKLGAMYIPGSDYTWKDFVDKINNYIVSKNKNGLYSEDKQIGAYFVTRKFLCNEKNENNEDKAIKFANKVLMYIWEDIARLNPSGWFEGINSLENLCKEFISRNINDSKLDSLKVFKDIFNTEGNSGE